MKNHREFAVCFLMFFSILFLHARAHTATFCVSIAAELQSALTTAASNGEDDVIQIVRRMYAGNFIYASTEAFGLRVEGGYVAGCTSRDVDPANTVLDGMATGTVLVLSSAQAVAFAVDGLTLQNGSANRQGGGLFTSTNGGEVTMTNNTLTNNTTDSNDPGGGGGGVRASASIVILTNNILSNNTARGGNSSGGGFWISAGSTVTLDNNTISSNTAMHSGGARISGSTITLINNTIENNTSNNVGGGVYLEGGIATLANNIISNNVASSGNGGGGVYLDRGSTVALINNIISNNIAGSFFGSSGGGIYVNSADTVVLTNNTIIANTASLNGGGIWLKLHDESDRTDIYNNIMWGNSAQEGADLYLDNDGDGDFLPSPVNLFNNDFDHSTIFMRVPFPIDPSNLDNLNPLFVDAANGDYHLQAGSPVINKGKNDAPHIPATDKDGRPRIIDSVIDMGAYEFGTLVVCDIQLNKTTFVNGDQVIAQVARLANPGPNPMPVEVKLWFELPGSPPPVPFLTVGADGSFVLSPGFNRDFGPLPLAIVQASFPRGTYGFNCRLLHAVTGAPLGEDFNPFQLQ